MAKTTAPLLSFDAAGSIAKTQVYSKWRGVPYVRRYVKPANPQTTAQMAVRTLFAQLREMWKVMPALVTASWDSFAQGRPFTGMNKWVGENVRVLNGEANFANVIGSPGSKGGIQPISLALTSPIAGEAHVSVVLPPLPDGWTQRSLIAFAFPEQVPGGIFQSVIFAGEAIGALLDLINLTGLTSGVSYRVCAFLTQTRPDGTKAYSVSLTGTQLIA